jgi:hypothetical protein
VEAASTELASRRTPTSLATATAPTGAGLEASASVASMVSATMATPAIRTIRIRRFVGRSIKSEPLMGCRTIAWPSASG